METVMHAPARWPPRLGHWLESAPVNNSLIALILINAVILGLETSPQVMTLEGWAMEVVRPVMAVHPLSWIFFLAFILASTFALLNLFIAVIVNAIHQEGAEDRRDTTAAEIARLRKETAPRGSHLGRMRKPSSCAIRRR